ncbi:MAG TPA: tetratricopeptide repeat protein [Anaerolineae bacterium]|nr:tetratricopeptide repeat protein [Anaerolineae bacterium]
MTNATKRVTPGQDVFLVEYPGQFAQREPLAATAHCARLFKGFRVAWQINTCRHLLREAKRWFWAPTETRAQVHNSEGLLAQLLTDWEEAIRCHQRALTLFHQAGNRPGIAYALNNLGLAYQGRGKPEKVVEYCKASLQLSQELDDEANMARAMGNLSLAYRQLGQLDEALAYAEQSLAHFRQLRSLSRRSNPE